MAETINGDLLVTGSVVANQNVQSGKIVSANQDVGAGRNITAINDIVAGNALEAGKIINSHGDIGAANDIVAQHDLTAANNVNAYNQVRPLTAPTPPAGAATVITTTQVATMAQAEPGLTVLGTDGNRYTIVLDFSVTPPVLQFVLQP